MVVNKKIERDIYIDFVKGLGIIFIVLGHSGAPQNILDFINLFHVAIFFIASGYLWNKKNANSRDLLIKYNKKKISTLYVPYVFWNIVFILCSNIFVYLHILSNKYFLTNKEIIKNIIKCFLLIKGTDIGGALWFVKILFFVSVGYSYICYINNIVKFNIKKIIWIILVVLFQILTIANFSFEPILQLLLGYLTYCIGVFIHEKELHKKKLPYKTLNVISFFLLFIMTKIGNISFATGQVTNIMYFIIASFLGWIFLYTIAKSIPYKCLKVFQFLSEYSMWILVLHLLCFKLVTYFFIKINNLNIVLLESFPVIKNNSYLWFIYTLVGISAPIIIGLLWENRKYIKKKRWKNDISSIS